MKKILFIASHRIGRTPSQRFRFEQYFNYLEQKGFICHFEYLITAEDDRIFYSPGHLIKKVLIYVKCWLKRYRDTVRARNYDIVFIQREAFITGNTYFERRFKNTRAKMVFDFDDSIWVENVSEANKNYAFLKDASKTSKLIAMADRVIAGNKYLADYAFQFSANVTVIPTTINTGEYKPVKIAHDFKKIIIGWSGSLTTIQHFKLAIPPLERIKAKYGDRISIKVIGDGNYRNDELEVISLNWNKEDELKELASFDIGIMPLPDNEWAKGKCGLKGLQYMALAIPAVMSAVGVNCEIVNDGNNGYLASTEDEWVQRLSLLIDNASLRREIGEAGRRTVIAQYSVEAQKDNYVKLFKEIGGLAFC